MANLHLAFGCPGIERLEMGQHLTELQRATFTDPPRLSRGALAAPTEPGLGIEFTPEMAKTFPFPPGLAERASGLMTG
jgi:L-alanine-DL-glutamate epimerase-like enolase superfamily enzyme